ncbi:MAG: DUF11 domain-containing protein [Planctomycetes bacterium]|nr:DUF11 domain-containing protein [Planctomycetota bacterium]
MKRVLGVGLAIAVALLATAASAGEGMGNANYVEKKGTLYSWCGFPGPCNEPKAAIVLLEKQGPAEVIVGDTFCYQIQISNRSAIDMIAVNLEDVVPAGFALQSVEPKPTREENGKMYWDLGTIPAKTAKLITITGSAYQTGCIVSNSLAKICYEMPLPLMTRVVQCNVEIQKTLPAVADICDVIPMCLTVFNVGSTVASNVCITDTLPEGLLTKDGQSEININVGSIPVGGHKTFTVDLQATRTGEFTNVACVTADRNCYSQSEASIKIVAPELELMATGPADGYICTSVPYQITVTNKGDSPARDVILTDCITGNFKIESVSDNGKVSKGGRIAWALGTINPGESRTVCLSGTSLVEGSIGSEFSVTARCADAKSVSHCLNLVGVPGIATSLSDSCDPVALGNEVTYTVTASNTGSRDATNLRYTVKLDEGMQFLCGDGVTTVAQTSDNTVVFAPVPVLPKGATVSWTVTVKATSNGDKRFVAEAIANELESPVTKAESTIFYQPSMAIVVAQ